MLQTTQPSLLDILSRVPSGRPDTARLVWPVFVYESEEALIRHSKEASHSDAGSLNVSGRVSASRLAPIFEKLTLSGLEHLVLYGVPNERMEHPQLLLDRESFLLRSVGEIKSRVPHLSVGLDLCVCQYVPSGHCRIGSDGSFLEQRTIEILLEHAALGIESGADFLMPSGMISDLLVPLKNLIRQYSHRQIAVLSQSAKFVSPLYGPFQQLAHAGSGIADKRAYQLPEGDSVVALQRIKSELDQGVDVAFVKPALSYLSLLTTAASQHLGKVGAFLTSGESLLFNQVAQKRRVSPALVRDEAFLKLFGSKAALIVSHQALEYAETISAEPRRLSV
ncbi:MAG: hypothetical protein KDD64_15460 [Bdellovibrionales bacterium]|nr:hypothetical protein [Bdellovibrionales bacterium]